MLILNSFEKKINAITIVICLTIIFSVYREYQLGMSQRSNEVISQFNDIHGDLRTQTQLITKFVSTSRRFAENYFLFSKEKISPWFKNLKYDKKYGGASLTAVTETYKKQKMGNLTTTSTEYLHNPEKRIEVNMALEMGSYISPSLFEIESSPWYYYTSDDFIYLAPYLDAKDFFFSKKLLVEKEFYKNATPALNPSRKGFWTSVYVDEAGLGLMVTYSEPVYDGNKFKGAVSMDVTIDQFNSIIQRRDFAVGSLILFNHAGQVLADPSSVRSHDPHISFATEHVPAELLDLIKIPKHLRQQSLVQLKSNLVHYEDFPELNSTLVYFVPAHELTWATLKNMSALVLFSMLCILLLFWLRRAFLNDYFMQQNFIQNAKMSALGRMAAGMAHEINNPLAIIVGKANGLKRIVDSSKTLNPEVLSQDLGKILNTANRIAKIIASLRAFSRNGAQDPFFDTNLKTWLNETLELCRQTLISYSINLTVNDLPDAIVAARESQLSQVLLNLLNNSVDAIKNQQIKEINISFELTKTMLRILVHDSGPRISQDVQTRLMEPFFTTKAPGAGTGLGLSISLTIMKEHGGSIRYLANEPRTTFAMEIPIKNKMSDIMS